MPPPLPARFRTVVETLAFAASARAEGMSEAERLAAALALAADPEAGALIKGSNGCRKMRLAGRGKGKSGGYRVMTYAGAPSGRLYLIAVLSKSSRETFSDQEVAAMATMVRGLE